MDAAHYIRRHHRYNPSSEQCASVVVKHITAPLDIVWSLVRRFDRPQNYKPFVSRCTVIGDLNVGSVREVNVKLWIPATTCTERLELLDDNEHILGIKIVGGDHRLKEGGNFNRLKKAKINVDEGPSMFLDDLVGADDDESAGEDEMADFIADEVEPDELGGSSSESKEAKVEDEFEPIINSEKYMTKKDDHIEKTDIPERIQNYSSILTVHPEVTQGRSSTLVIESFVVDIPNGNTKDETCYFVRSLINCNLESLSNISARMVVQDQM